jgi:peptidoglycan hydrolase-like protein with peptidoglycan-binding domain
VPRSKRKSDSEADAPRFAALARLGWSRRDAVAFAVAVLATVAIVVNGLLLQTGPHPAPMFKDAVAALAAASKGAPKDAAKDAAKDVAKDAARTLPRPRPPEATAKVEARPTPEIIADIQRELTRRGYYDGVVDGRYGPRTDAAVRDFEQASGLKPSAEPNEALLAAIKRSPTKPAKAPSGMRPAPLQQVRLEPAADASSKRVLAAQRALAEYGYGQIKPTGVVDADTKAAVERFERERKLPITGQLSDRVTRELASVTGRPLE